MREIKFRMWNPNTKVMVDLKKITPFALHPDLERDHLDGLFIPFRENMPLMQFTGLHDKNGKEIWEGDIVKTINEEIGKVVFSIGAFWAEYLWPHNWDPMAPAEIVRSDMKVIGNIYENPELLERQK